MHSGQQAYQKTSRIEIKGIDSLRWAKLHLPLGVLLSVWLVFHFQTRQKSFDWMEFLHLLAMAPLATALVVCLAWFQASLLNAFLAIMRGGPIFYVVIHESGGSVHRSLNASSYQDAKFPLPDETGESPS